MRVTKKFGRIVSLVLALSILTTVFYCGGVCAEEYKNTKFYYCKDCVTGEYQPMTMDFNFDFDMLASGNNQEYSKDLAIVSGLFATAAYAASDPEKADMAGSNAIIDGFSYSSDDPVGLGTALGFEDGYFYDLYSKQCFTDGEVSVEVPSYNVDTDDSTAYYFGHKKVGDTEVIIFSLRGTNGTAEEWSSNFDVGADTENYYSMTGEHPDWTDKENHKGFDVAKTRALKAFNSYVENNVDSTAKKAVLVTGHSRGAAVANLVGKELEDSADYTPFTYTFAAPGATTNKDYQSYNTIWNIVNTDDIVTMLPTTGMGFNKFGHNIEQSICDGKTSSGESLEKAVEKMTGWRDYDKNMFCDDVVEAFDNVASNREALYEIDNSWLCQRTYFGTDDYAQKVLNDLKDYRLDKYASIDVEEGTFYGTNVTVHICPAFVVQQIANLAAFGADYLKSETYYATLYWPSAIRAKIDFVHCYVDGMVHPHLMASYYAIVKETT